MKVRFTPFLIRFSRFCSALLAVFLIGCGRDRIEAEYPNGKPKVIRSYGLSSLWSGASPGNLIREQKFYYNDHKESEAHFRHGILHGRYEDFWHNGQKKSQGEYRDGKKEGDWEAYFNQYTLASKGSYQNGQQEGPWNNFWESGALKSQGEYRAGKETGTWKEWAAKGDLISENSCFEANADGRYLSFHANKTVNEDYQCKRGIPSGAYLKKDPDGTVMERGGFDAQGRKDGTWETFHPGGAKASSRRFADGLDQDSAYAWDEAGRLRERAQFDSGTGERLSYDSLGRLIERRHFLKGQPDGESWAYWPASGQGTGPGNGPSRPPGPKRSLILYHNGKPVSMLKWYANGKPMADGVFENGHRAGEWKDWWENGKLKEVSHFQDGTLHGDRFFYDEQGKLQRTQTYEHGFPSKGKIPKGLGGMGNAKGTVTDAIPGAAVDTGSGGKRAAPALKAAATPKAAP
jgi:YD repeat-containing protein